MPTKTTSPSRSSRAATAAIISAGVWVTGGPPSKPIVHARAHPLVRAELLEPTRACHVLGSIRHAVDELLQVPLERRRIARDLLPRDVEGVVPVVVPLRVRRVRAP